MENFVTIVSGWGREVERVRPIVKVGDCLFGAKKKLSLVRATDQVATNRLIEIMLSGVFGSTEGPVERLNISAAIDPKKSVVFLGSDRENDEKAIGGALSRANLEERPENFKYVYEEIFHFGTHRSLIKEIYKGTPGLQFLIISLRNHEMNLPDKGEWTLKYLDSLRHFSHIHHVCTIIVFNQHMKVGRPKNGPFRDDVISKFFTVGKFSFHYPECFLLESVRAPYGHTFWNVQVDFSRPEQILTRGIDKNVLPK